MVDRKERGETSGRVGGKEGAVGGWWTGGRVGGAQGAVGGWWTGSPLYIINSPDFSPPVSPLRTHIAPGSSLYILSPPQTSPRRSLRCGLAVPVHRVHHCSSRGPPRPGDPGSCIVPRTGRPLPDGPSHDQFLLRRILPAELRHRREARCFARIISGWIRACARPGRATAGEGERGCFFARREHLENVACKEERTSGTAGKVCGGGGGIAAASGTAGKGCGGGGGIAAGKVCGGGGGIAAGKVCRRGGGIAAGKVCGGVEE